eukprot:TRINITY_DN5523_c0_g1_i1.p1 TRINITY_DN5523_c0_g1~~TRINITY_DN5523_c0_g1_i1.p1  ORF type:complete len:515 (+),score=87.33 TRINITY_DN5523_c0_g1_i1:20-1564(+)
MHRASTEKKGVFGWVSYVWQAPIRYEPYEHAFMRFFFVVTMLYTFHYDCLEPFPFPNGLATYFDLTFICSESLATYLHALLFLFSSLYILNIFPFPSLIYITIIHIARGTALNSDGSIGHAYQPISLILVAQCLAYVIHPISSKYSTAPSDEKISVEDLAVYMGQQAFAATYVVAALTKMVVSRGKWISESFNLLARVIKTNEENHFSYENRSDFSENLVAGVFLRVAVAYPLIARLMFGSAFFLELFAGLFLANRWTMLFGGLNLYSMHEGIRIIMQLNFTTNKLLLLTYYVNLPYWIVLGTTYLWQHYRFFASRYLPVSVTSILSHYFLKQSRKKSTDSPSEANDRTDTSPSPSISSNPRSIIRKFVLFSPWVLIITIVLCLMFKEAYPLSHFPMYAAIRRPQISVFYVTDETDREIPLVKYLHAKSPQLKKTFGSYVRRLIAEKKYDKKDPLLNIAAGNMTINQFSTEFDSNQLKKFKPKYPLKLKRVYVLLQLDGSLVRTYETLGYLSVT